MRVFELITSRQYIQKKAAEHNGFTDNYKGISIITLSRLDKTKGTDLIIYTCRLLKDKGYQFKWYIMGRGNRKGYYKLISSLGVLDHVIFLNPTSNPFPFLKKADIYVQPSQYEGKSNAINEAKALCKPIIITKFQTSYEIITHMENGIISEMDPDSLAASVQALIEAPSLRLQFSKYWKINFKGNEEEVNKIFDLIK